MKEGRPKKAIDAIIDLDGDISVGNHVSFMQQSQKNWDSVNPFMEEMEWNENERNWMEEMTDEREDKWQRWKAYSVNTSLLKDRRGFF